MTTLRQKMQQLYTRRMQNENSRRSFSYMLIAAILMGLLAYLIYSLKIIYSIAWSLEEVVTELVIPMVLICVSLNIAISVFWGSGLLLSDTNIDSMLALPIPLRTLICPWNLIPHSCKANQMVFVPPV